MTNNEDECFSLNVAKNFAVRTWVIRSVEPLGDIPVMTKMILYRGKVSGRTFNRMSANVSDPCWSSL